MCRLCTTAHRERVHLLAMRRLHACPGAVETVERARLAARARRAAVAGLDDRLRASRRAALNAHHDTLRAAQEKAQRGDQEIIERSRAAARAWRESARARRAEVPGGIPHTGGTLATGPAAAHGGYTSAVLARTRSCCSGRCQQRPYWYYGYTVGGRRAPS